MRLSAGQRQLIALARAFLADPAVLIVDDATSSVDAAGERMVQHALATVLADRTALVITHRHATVAIADRVLILKHGRIVDHGQPDHRPLRADGRYAAPHRLWSGRARDAFASRPMWGDHTRAPST
jgi:ATP-binding cassette, subfamily B, bacterial